MATPAPRRWAYLTPTVWRPFFRSPVSSNRHRLPLTEMLYRQITHVITDRVCIPDGLTQYVLHPIRTAITGIFGQRPTVLGRHVRDQFPHQRPRPLPGLDPCESVLYTREDLVELRLPHARVYRGSYGHHRILMSRHN